jgi:precorrin isomerase
MATNSKAKKPDIGFVVADAIGWFSAADSREMAGELQGIPAARQGGELQH